MYTMRCHGSVFVTVRNRSLLATFETLIAGPASAGVLDYWRLAISTVNSYSMGFTFGSGAGSRLPAIVLIFAGVSTLVAVLVSAMSIYLQLKNYRKPSLQRFASRQDSVQDYGLTFAESVQNGYTNYAHGPNIRNLVSHLIIFT